MSVLVCASLVVTVLAVGAIWSVGRGRAEVAGRFSGHGRKLRIVAFVLAIVPAAYVVATFGRDETADGSSVGDLAWIAGLPFLLTGVAAVLPRSGSTVVPLTWGTALVLAYFVGVLSIVGIGVLYWPATAALLTAAIVQTGGPSQRRRADRPPPDAS